MSDDDGGDGLSPDHKKYLEAFRKQVTTDKWLAGLERVSKQLALDKMKRWGQENCEHCGGPLENVLDVEGRPLWRICWPCEAKFQECDARREE